MSQTVPLKHLAEINGRSLGENTEPTHEFCYIDISSVGQGALLTAPQPMTFESAPSRARRLVRTGDTIVSTVRTYLKAVWPVQPPADNLVVSTGFAVVTPRRVDPRYLSWWLRSDVFIEEVVARSVGVSYPAINALELGDLAVRVPSPATQRAIAGYLDTETARIDALTAKKRRMIDLLEERRDDAVERHVLGLNLNPLRTAESVYLTTTPAQWVETSLRHLGCHVQTGPFGSQLHADEYADQGWPVVNPANLRNGCIRPITEMSITDAKRDELSRHILRAGDIVFGRRGEMGRTGLVGTAEAGWLCGTGSLRLRLSPSSPLLSGYLSLLLQTRALRAYFEIQSIGSTMDNLNSEIVLAAPCVVPSLDEQRSIAEAARDLGRLAQATVAALTRQIALLQEHRQALITAAVTGELDISGVAA